VQAGGGLVQHVQRVAALACVQLGGSRATSRREQLRGRLAQPQVAQTHLVQHVPRTAHDVLTREA
jgi:hypothetical protein